MPIQLQLTRFTVAPAPAPAPALASASASDADADDKVRALNQTNWFILLSNKLSIRSDDEAFGSSFSFSPPVSVLLARRERETNDR